MNMATSIIRPCVSSMLSRHKILKLYSLVRRPGCASDACIAYIKPIHWKQQFQFRYDCQVCFYSSQPNRKSFIGQLIENIQQEFAKNKEMKENLKRFREEAERLEQSDALQKARQKYQSIEAETNKGSQQLKEHLEVIKDKLKEGLEEAQKSDIGKKGRELTEDVVRSAWSAAGAVAKQGEQLGKSSAFKAVSQGVKAVKQEIDESTSVTSRMYKAPEKLRKRSDRQDTPDDRPITPNMSATGVELHKDSKWTQSWQNFKDNNPYVNKVFDWKTKYDESDNPVVRASRVLTDKVTDLFGGLFQKTELSEVLTEICKIDPTFEKNQFLRDCEVEIIPNILEAMIQGNLDILKDWCHEAAYNTLATPIKQAQSLGYKYDSKILDIGNVDLAMGKIMEQGPVLIITFQAQQIMAVRNGQGAVVEGDNEKILRMHYVWVLCRDQTELDPKAAWRLMDLSANSTQQWL